MKRVTALLLVIATASVADAGASGGFWDSTSSTATFTAASSFGTACSPPATVIANRDATIYQAVPAQSSGFMTQLFVVSEADRNARALLGFDLPGTGGCGLVSAQLRVYQEAGDRRMLAVYGLATTWSQSVTWNNQPSKLPGATRATAPGTGWLTIDVTAQVRDLYRFGNNGLIVGDASENAVGIQFERFTSAYSSTSSQRPQLLLVFG